MSDNTEIVYKILLLSCTPAGKTCILNRFVENRYNGNFLATTGINTEKK